MTLVHTGGFYSPKLFSLINIGANQRLLFKSDWPSSRSCLITLPDCHFNFFIYSNLIELQKKGTSVTQPALFYKFGLPTAVATQQAITETWAVKFMHSSGIKVGFMTVKKRVLFRYVQTVNPSPRFGAPFLPMCYIIARVLRKGWSVSHVVFDVSGDGGSIKR